MNRAERVYTHLLQEIMAHRLKPGDWVDRREIAQRLELSLMPVSDAVQRLTAEGFLVTVARRGTQVRVPSRDDLRGQLLLREALECQSARLYCGKTIRGALEGLQALAEQADRLDSDSAAAWRHDLAFHQALVGLTACAALQEAFDRVMNLAIFQQSALLTPYPLNKGDSHAGLLRDLCRLDSDAAEARIRKHIRTGKESFHELVG